MCQENVYKYILTLVTASFLFLFSLQMVMAQSVVVSTTTLNISICGDSIVNPGEDCDIPGETGTYSTTIAGRQCNAQCRWGPYCGDTILQTIHGEECDDGNNVDDDFCSADCKVEPSGGGGGSSSGGGGGSSSGGSVTELGDTQVSIVGLAYPQTTVNILLDGVSIGSVRSNSSGDFTFSKDVDPGTSTFGFWATDRSNVRSITFNTTFDVTQGAITNINGILLPPTISVNEPQIDPGDVISITGEAPPNVSVEIMFDDGSITETTTSDGNGKWSLEFDTSRLSIAEHLVKARYSTGNILKNQSSFSTALQLFIGVDGQPTNNSDLNRDGTVDLIDFSILIFWWGTDGGDSNPPADINTNGNVGIEDFSILLFNWTG